MSTTLRADDSLLPDEARVSSVGEDGVSLFAARVRSLPEELDGMLARGIDPAVATGLQGARFVVTGVGGSRQPASFLARELRRCLGLRAEFVPVSAFLGEPPMRGAVLIVFSQGLSPNAFLALRHASAYARTIVFTSVEPNGSAASSSPSRRLHELVAHGVEVVATGPAREDGLLVRVVGPSVARLAACLFLREISSKFGGEVLPEPPAELAADVRRALGLLTNPTPSELFARPLVFVGAAGVDDDCAGVAWAVLETLLVPAPLVVDIGHFAHGAFQQVYSSGLDVVSFELPDEPETLAVRLGSMLVPSRHRLHRVRARSCRPYASFEHEAAVLGALVDELEARPRELTSWPGKGLDGPLYDLGR
jgi:hypothetical protein